PRTNLLVAQACGDQLRDLRLSVSKWRCGMGVRVRSQVRRFTEPSAIAWPRCNCCPDVNSAWNFDAPSAAVAARVASHTRGASTPVLLAPGPLRTVSAAPKQLRGSSRLPGGPGISLHQGHHTLI